MRLPQILKTYRIFGSGLLTELLTALAVPGGILSPVVTLTYGVSIAVDASLGNFFTVTPTDGVAFAIAAPSNVPLTGYTQLLTFTIRNTTGAPLGVLTWNPVFKLGAAWAQPATGFSQTIQFRWDGTNWVEINRTAADVSN